MLSNDLIGLHEQGVGADYYHGNNTHTTVSSEGEQEEEEEKQNEAEQIHT